MTIRAILWDFGDTLCDETWMLAPMPGAASWPAIFPDVLARDRLGERWNVGTASTADVATAAAGQLACDTDPVLAHMRSCCRDIRFYPTVLALAAACRLP